MPKSRKKAGSKKPDLKRLSKTVTRIHEAGHVVVAWFDRYLPTIKKATVKPKDDALGYVKIKWKKHHSQMQGVEETHALIRFFLGGRVAESVCGGARVFGAGHDLWWANMEASFLLRFGLSKVLGNALPDFLPMGGKTRQRVDDAHLKLMRDRTLEAETLLRARKQDVLAVAHAFQGRRTLKTKHLKKILGPRPAPAFTPVIVPDKKKTNARRK